MLESPEISEIPEQLIAVIPLTIPRSEIQAVMGPGIAELIATVRGQGVDIVGPWFSHHLKMSPGVFDFEIGVPVSRPVTASGRVRPGTWPQMRVARALLHGGYEGLGPAWGQLGAWITDSGLKSAEDLWEVYVRGPEASPDPKDWRTELNRPLVR